MLFHRRCPSCGRSARFVCDICWAQLEVDRTPSFGLFCYDEVCRNIVLEAKNRGRRDLLRPLGRALAAHLETRLDPDVAWTVTWVPCSRSGRANRGFDQGNVLATIVGARLGATVRPLLTRLDEVPQTGRSRAERLVGPALGLHRPFGRVTAAVPPDIVVLDDVVTTGASLRCAASLLLQAGARLVVPAALASVAPPGGPKRPCD